MKKDYKKILPIIGPMQFEPPISVPVTNEIIEPQYVEQPITQEYVEQPVIPEYVQPNTPIQRQQSSAKTFWLGLLSGSIGALIVCLLAAPILYWMVDAKAIETKVGTTTIIENSLIEDKTIEETVSNTISAAVVTVLVHDFWGPSGSGSGVVYHIDAKGSVYILTNAHVVEKISKVSVFRNNESLDTAEMAEVLAKDVDADIAVLKISQPVNSYPLIMEFADSSTAKLGQKVLAIGSPLGPVFSGSVTSGIVSGLDREVPIDDEGLTQNYLQTDAAVNGGNSGGALVNMQGKLLGVISAKVTESENIGLAIPANNVVETLRKMDVPLPDNVKS